MPIWLLSDYATVYPRRQKRVGLTAQDLFALLEEDDYARAHDPCDAWVAARGSRPLRPTRFPHTPAEPVTPVTPTAQKVRAVIDLMDALVRTPLTYTPRPRRRVVPICGSVCPGAPGHRCFRPKGHEPPCAGEAMTRRIWPRPGSVQPIDAT